MPLVDQDKTSNVATEIVFVATLLVLPCHAENSSWEALWVGGLIFHTTPAKTPIVSGPEALEIRQMINSARSGSWIEPVPAASIQVTVMDSSTALISVMGKTVDAKANGNAKTISGADSLVGLDPRSAVPAGETDRRSNHAERGDRGLGNVKRKRDKNSRWKSRYLLPQAAGDRAPVTKSQPPVSSTQRHGRAASRACVVDIKIFSRARSDQNFCSLFLARGVA